MAEDGCYASSSTGLRPGSSSRQEAEAIKQIVEQNSDADGVEVFSQ